MLTYAEKATAFCQGRKRDDIDADEMFEAALARVLELVGEAAAQTSVPFRELYPEIPWAKAIGMRNRLIHGYPDVDPDVLWSTVEQDIPPLIAQLRGILTG